MYIHKVEKGTSLIEITAAAAIFSMFAVFAISVLFNFINQYKSEMLTNNDSAYFSNGTIVINKFLKEGTVEIEDDNRIKITKDQNSFDVILLNKYLSRVVIDYYILNMKVTSNNIIMDVKDFNVVKNKNVFYIFVTLKDGKRYMKCFPIKE